MRDERQIVIGVDQGTTNTKAIALDRSGRVLGQAARAIATETPRLGWVEQDPLAMLDNVVACVREVLDSTGHSAEEVAGLGIANQTETLVVWDPRTGLPLLPAIVWKCRRGDEEIAGLRDTRTIARIRARTGLDLDPTFTAPKLKWLFENRPEIADGLKRGDYLFGTVDSWLIWKLTGGVVHATDASNASRTMLFDIGALAWSDELMDMFGLAIARKPEVRRSTGPFGRTQAALFGAPIAITAALGDQQASLFGHGCFDPGQLKVTYGTGAFVWLNAGPGTADLSIDGLVRTVAWQIDEPCYALEGFVMYAGATLDWLASRLSIDGGAPAIVARAQQAGSSDGVALVPAFQGLASPWWRPDVRAGLIGMTEATTAAHICHAGLEAVCYQIRTILELIKSATGRDIALAKVDGGPTASAYLMQLQADIAQQALAPATFDSMTPYGGALMAGLGAGFWRDLGELRRLVKPETQILPDRASARRWQEGHKRWLAATEALLALYRGQDHGRAQA